MLERSIHCGTIHVGNMISTKRTRQPRHRIEGICGVRIDLLIQMAITPLAGILSNRASNLI